MADLTIKELAEKIGVSKTAINKKVTPEMRKDFFSKVGNRFVISEEGQKAITTLFVDDSLGDIDQQKTETSKTTTTSQTSKTSGKTQTKLTTSAPKAETSQTESETMQTLSIMDIQLIENYQNQLLQKDKQIAELHKLLDQQQQLTLQSNKQNERLQLQLEEYEDENENQRNVMNEPPRKKSWWKLW